MSTENDIAKSIGGLLGCWFFVWAIPYVVKLIGEMKYESPEPSPPKYLSANNCIRCGALMAPTMTTCPRCHEGRASYELIQSGLPPVLKKVEPKQQKIKPKRERKTIKLSENTFMKWLFLCLGLFGLVFLPTGRAGTYGRISEPSWEFFWVTDRTVDTTRLIIQSAVFFGLAYLFFQKDTEKR